MSNTGRHHLTPQGEVKPCKALVRCRYTHFRDSLEEMEAVRDQIISNKTGSTIEAQMRNAGVRKKSIEELRVANEAIPGLINRMGIDKVKKNIKEAEKLFLANNKAKKEYLKTTGKRINKEVTKEYIDFVLENDMMSDEVRSQLLKVKNRINYLLNAKPSKNKLTHKNVRSRNLKERVSRIGAVARVVGEIEHDPINKIFSSHINTTKDGRDIIDTSASVYLEVKYKNMKKYINKLETDSNVKLEFQTTKNYNDNDLVKLRVSDHSGLNKDKEMKDSDVNFSLVVKSDVKINTVADLSKVILDTVDYHREDYKYAFYYESKKELTSATLDFLSQK